MLTLPVYLDNHSTTRTDPRVLETMLPYFSERYGNASSASHRYGWDAEEAVERAREQVAALIGADPREVIFTSGATEANMMALRGTLPHLAKKGRHLISSAIEHHAVLDPLEHLAREGWQVTLLNPDAHGQISVQAVADALTDQTVLVSIMAANNEVGTINPVGEIGRLCHDRQVLFHTDATQAVAKIPLDVNADRIDLLSLTAHKFYGPKGVGALYLRRRDPLVRITPLFEGGGQERGYRAGTLNVPGIVGLGRAAELARAERDAEAVRVGTLRDRLHQGLADRVEAITLNGHPTERLPGNLNLSFAYVDGEALMMGMRDLCVSSGAACSSAVPEPSHVLMALGRDEDLARASLRFGLGRFTTEPEVEFAIETVASQVARLRAQSPLWAARGEP